MAHSPRSPAPDKPPSALRRAPVAQLHLRIHLGPEVALGPGKADLLEGIDATGSIAAAGRQLGMSYKRAWVLVDTMNACFRTPLVAAAKGGKTGGGASLTPLGKKVVASYRRMQQRAIRAVATDIAQLRRHLLRAPRKL